MNIKQRAINLRLKGWSYNIIIQRLGVPKSTLCHWLKEVPYKPNAEVRKRIKEGPAKSAEKRSEKRLRSISLIKQQSASELGRLNKRDLWMIGIGLYIGEGTKAYESTQIINSNPHIIKLSMRWFRDICEIPINNFSITLHIYPDISETAAKKYWSKITDIPISQFTKTQTDRRTNKTNYRKRKLPYGTAEITIRACGESKYGVKLHRRIMGWIDVVYK